MMQPQTSKSFVLVISTLLLLSLAILILAQETEDELEFNYKKGDERGPENWGNIKEEWAMCNTGKMQSPINLFSWLFEPVPYNHKIFRSYRPAQTILKNRGHDIKLEWVEGGSKIRLNGTDYVLLNCHWHSPSEHTINGQRYPLEGHFVHQAADKSIAVIGFLYKLGSPDPFLSSIEEKLKEISSNSKQVSTGVIDPLKVRKAESGIEYYYRYKGSLTTPACTEDVIWTVETKLGTVSEEQVQLLRDAVNDGARYNARPLQPLNRRKVHLYLAINWWDTFIRTPLSKFM